jgi:hypothetical protein
MRRANPRYSDSWLRTLAKQFTLFLALIQAAIVSALVDPVPGFEGSDRNVGKPTTRILVVAATHYANINPIYSSSLTLSRQFPVPNREQSMYSLLGSKISLLHTLGNSPVSICFNRYIFQRLPAISAMFGEIPCKFPC